MFREVAGDSMTSRTFVKALIYEGMDTPITFKQYPTSAGWLLRLNKRVKEEIATRI
ncbi:MAG: hypothetical protein RSF70_09670 [Ruthenibacterium sp.]